MSQIGTVKILTSQEKKKKKSKLWLCIHCNKIVVGTVEGWQGQVFNYPLIQGHEL